MPDGTAHRPGNDRAAPALDRLDGAWRERVAGRRVGVLTASAARTLTAPGFGRRADAALADAGAAVVRLFSPEHGLNGVLDPAEAEPDRGGGGVPPVVSLYGPRRRPERRHLCDLDAVVVDLPDVGCRAYTYAATMLAVLAAAAECGTPVIILDRPNPLGRAALGPGVAPGRTSFVAPIDVPLRHGLTMGELALLDARNRGLPDPVVAPCLWDGSPLGADAPWIPPSPGLPTSETAFVYAGMVLIEGVNLSEGRGTTRPFLSIGAPWLPPDALHLALERAPIPGVAHWPLAFRPTASKHKGEICHGVGLRVSNRRTADPIALAVHLLAAAARLAPDKLTTSPFLDQLSGGDDDVRRLCAGEAEPETLLARWRVEADAFRHARRQILLYPDGNEGAEAPK